MSNEVGNVRAVVWAWAYGGLIGAVAAGLLMFLGGWDFSSAAFVGILLTAVIGGIVTWAGRPLPSFGDGSEERARAAGAAALAAGAAAASRSSAPSIMATVPSAAPPIPQQAAVEAQSKPVMLASARNGVPDDLKVIKGIGPKLEVMLHRMGVYHFDQIASWQAAEIAWVDDNLEGFKGRVSRDLWVDQARILAAGGSVDDYVASGDGTAR